MEQLIKNIPRKAWIIVGGALAAIVFIGLPLLWVFGPGGDSFYVTDANWNRGVARKFAGYFVPANSSGHDVGRIVTLKNGETRSIVRAEKKGPFINVYMAGAPLDPAVHGYPPEFKLGAVQAVPSDAFYITDANWDRGVARRWAGFFVRSGTPGYEAGRRVKLRNGEVRSILKVEERKPYLNIFLEGKALDPNVHGTPDGFAPQ